MALLVHAAGVGLACDRHDRGTVHVRVGDAGDEIACARPQGGEADAGAAGEAAVYVRHEGGGLLVARQDELEVAVEQHIHDVDVLFARDPVDGVDSFVLEATHEQLCSLHGKSPFGLLFPPDRTCIRAATGAVRDPRRPVSRDRRRFGRTLAGSIPMEVGVIHKIRGFIMPLLVTLSLLLAVAGVQWPWLWWVLGLLDRPRDDSGLLGPDPDRAQHPPKLSRYWAHLRFILEDLGPELHQYVVESNKGGRPFNRDQRSLMYQRAKDVEDKKPFGTELDTYAPGYIWLTHSLVPKPIPEDPVAALRFELGGPDCVQPVSVSVYNISAMSFGALSANAIRALNAGRQARRLLPRHRRGRHQQLPPRGWRGSRLAGGHGLLRLPDGRRAIRRGHVPGAGRCRRSGQGDRDQALAGGQAGTRGDLARAPR